MLLLSYYGLLWMILRSASSTHGTHIGWCVGVVSQSYGVFGVNRIGGVGL